MQATRFGSSYVELEGDIIHVHWVGLPTLAQLQAVYAAVAELLDQTGSRRVLFDVRAAGLPGAELRRYAAEWWRPRAHHVALASYGMTLGVRVMMEMVRRAIELIGGGSAKMINCGTEAEARAWLSRQPAGP
ncbi:MAG: STAS/SEC14 domain-containing protein [Polyangia bacterium]